MNNNDILRRVRYAFDFNDERMMALFALGGIKATRAEVSDWLKKEDDDSFQKCQDKILATFLNGLIMYKRGAREGDPPEPERRLTNNLILMKLRIALALKSEDLLEILESGGIRISKHELSAFFRRPSERRYQECKDQILRNFLKGLQLRLRKE